MDNVGEAVCGMCGKPMGMPCVTNVPTVPARCYDCGRRSQTQSWRMTKDEALAILIVHHPCGCVEHWEMTPPLTLTCAKHIGVGVGGLPARFQEARNALVNYP